MLSAHLLLLPLLLLPFLPSTLSTPSPFPIPALTKRNDCHGSSLCLFTSKTATAALGAYNATANAHTYYHAYTSYTSHHFAAIYVCPEGKYPGSVTGAEIYDAGMRVSSTCDHKCGTAWLYDTDERLKCRVTLNYCSRCKNVVNGRSGDGSGSPDPVTATVPAPAASSLSVGRRPDLHG